MNIESKFKNHINTYPDKPGVYLMKDKNHNIIYVGKAACLRKRLCSYFTSPGKLNPKTLQLVNNISDIDYYVTPSEEEAIILELNLIKQYRPHFNISMKDDKTFPYIKIDTRDQWPRVIITRRLEPDGARYFGPFGSAFSMRQTLVNIKKVFPFRSCKKIPPGGNPRPCLEYDLGHCPGPCSGKCTRTDYMKTITQLILFLEGRHSAVIKNLTAEMKQAAGSQDFERAAKLRDQIRSLQDIMTFHAASIHISGSQDVIAIAKDGRQAYAQVFFIRDSKIVGRDGFLLSNTFSETPSSIITSFVKQYYNSTVVIPSRIFIQRPVDDKQVIEKWLFQKCGHSVSLMVPVRGPEKELMEMVEANAKQGLERSMFRFMSSENRAKAALEQLTDTLRLPKAPVRLEGYDVSNLQGSMAVGSMVVFIDGIPDPSLYRRFRINSVPGADDYAMLKEIIGRRFKHVYTSGTDSWGNMPDLVLIDGGKGQLNAVIEVMQKLDIQGIPIIGLAKEKEEVFIPGKRLPADFPSDSPALQLLCHVRDEAHRFAIGYHRNIRNKRNVASVLDAVPGIGPQRRKALIKRFGSTRAVLSASIEDLTEIKGINAETARLLKELS